MPIQVRVSRKDKPASLGSMVSPKSVWAVVYAYGLLRQCWRLAHIPDIRLRRL
jgi:hypothetical protein